MVCNSAYHTYQTNSTSNHAKLGGLNMKKAQVIILCTILVIVAIGTFFLIKYLKDNNIPEETVNKVINPNVSNEQKGIYDEIINKYLTNNDNEVVDTSFRFLEKQNVLVETIYKTGFRKFEMFNAETKECNSLPSVPTIMKFYRFNNENEIFFLSDGTNTVSDFREFPYIIKCVRNSIKSDFEIKTEPFFLDVSQEVVLGRNGGSVVAFEILNKDSDIEIFFKPASSNKMDFSMPFDFIPITHTIYAYHIDNNVRTKRLIFDFENTQLDTSINNEGLKNIKNEYFEGVECRNESNGCRLIIDLKEKAKQYNVNIRHSEDKDISYAIISFK